ncbi:MAG: sodium dependent nucleoside transporter [Caulobacter sp.]|nr:sodium dependent nucleoside transporter [Caulobacter sp.]
MFSALNAQSLLGPLVIMLICWGLSENKRRFPLMLMLVAVALQVVLVLALFGIPILQAGLQGVGVAVRGLADATHHGSAFVFGYLGGEGAPPFTATNPDALFVFGFQVLPVILVVCALSAVLWHWGILKVLTKGFGFLFRKTLGLRGPPALATAATIFMGQVEGPIFIRAYLDKLTRSELFLLLVVGMTCVSGSTMVAYVAILSPTLHNAAAHVLTASIISAPAGVLLARILVPPDLAERGGDIDQMADKHYDSSVDALMKGTGDGLQVVLNVAASLIVFVALVALANQLLAAGSHVVHWAAALVNVNIPDQYPPTIEGTLGYVFSPLAFSLGVPWHEAGKAGALLGTKLVLTEFIAFIKLGADPAISDRTRMIMTYALCGFANVASVGINVAGFSVLAPQRREEILGMVWKAMMAGFLATCLTASIVGIMPIGLFGH